MKYKTNPIYHLLGILCAFCLMIVFLITSVEAVAYWTPDYYETEYTKYSVDETVHMEMEDLLEVTDEMMEYLRGGRADLHVPTVVDGQPREFFNEREIAHMEDVRGLFLAGLSLRRICLLLAVLSAGLLLWRKAPVRRLLPRMLCAGTLLFLLITALLAAVISTDFTKYFIVFHKIFFKNDLWILNPATDLLINIVPEPFFVDTAARIAVTFGLMTAALFAACLLFIRFDRKKSASEGHRGADVGKSGLFLLALALMTGAAPLRTQASTDWPANVSIESDAGIVMDARTGAVLYGKNIHSVYAPASITKVLTSLIVLEHCSMDEMVTFSENAVYNVESNSSSAGYDTGDTASVKDCLYALLLKSANESANALAEHVAGTTEEFAKLMNEKAAQLGCQDSHFSNPSGLNDESHYVSAYDMALITRAAFENDDFAKIVATTYYELPPNKQNPEGQGISPGNKMIKKNWPEQYRPDVLGGKTGYTSIALNTLVNGARQGDTELITVILHSQKTQYEDTSRLLDFGFSNFQSVRIADHDQTFSAIGDDLKFAGLPTSDEKSLTIDPDSRVILPKTADFSETTVSLSYEVPENAPEGAIACVQYFLGDNRVGQAYLTLTGAARTGETLPEALLEIQPTLLDSAASDGAGDVAGDSSKSDGNDGSKNDGNDSSNNDGNNGSKNSVKKGPGADASEEPSLLTGKPEESGGADKAGLFHLSLAVPSLFWKLLAAILLVGGLTFFSGKALKKRREQEEAARLARRKRREDRLRETGLSETDFNLLVQNRRQTAADTKKADRSRGETDATGTDGGQADSDREENQHPGRARRR